MSIHPLPSCAQGGIASVGDLSSELCQLSDSLGAECERLVEFEQRLAHGEWALKYLIRANQGMVHQIARQLRPRGSAPDLDDMLQDGNMGLMQAVVRFEPSSGCRLSTYSYNWIRGLIMTGLHRCVRATSPSHSAASLRAPAAPRGPRRRPTAKCERAAKLTLFPSLSRARRRQPCAGGSTR